jgi:hypothetical protein
MFIHISLCLFVASRVLRLAHSPLDRAVGSWVAAEPSGTVPPSRLGSPRLGAELPSPRRAQKNR